MMAGSSSTNERNTAGDQEAGHREDDGPQQPRQDEHANSLGVISTASRAEAKVKKETYLSIAAQVCLPFLCAGMGMVAAGLYFDFVQHWTVFKGIPEIFIMVPALLGLKGNLEMTLASRLSTHANIGNMDSAAQRWSMALCNLALVQCQALVVGFLAAAVAMLLGWAPVGKFDLFDASLLCASALMTASMASFLLGIVMILVVLLSRRYGINPDNIATPVAASLGDVLTLILLSHTAEFLYQHEEYFWLPALLMCTCVLSTPLWIYLARKNPHTRVVLITGWLPVVVAMVISSMGGLILDVAISTYQSLAVFQPVINGIGGNLAGVQSSRMATHLHRYGQLGKFPPNEDDTILRPPWTVYLGKHAHATAARVLISFVVPGHVIFLLVISLIKYGGPFASMSFPFVFAYLIAATLQVAALLYIGQMMILLMWRRKIDPDNSAIPYLTALGDLLGTGLLALAFHLLFLLGDRAITIDDGGY